MVARTVPNRVADVALNGIHPTVMIGDTEADVVSDAVLVPVKDDYVAFDGVRGAESFSSIGRCRLDGWDIG